MSHSSYVSFKSTSPPDVANKPFLLRILLSFVSSLCVLIPDKPVSDATCISNCKLHKHTRSFLLNFLLNFSLISFFFSCSISILFNFSVDCIIFMLFSLFSFLFQFQFYCLIFQFHFLILFPFHLILIDF